MASLAKTEGEDEQYSLGADFKGTYYHLRMWPSFFFLFSVVVGKLENYATKKRGRLNF